MSEPTYTEAEMITQDRLHELFEYDGNNLVWKVRKGRAHAGCIAGHGRSDGYRRVKVDQIFYYAHRLIWLYVTGEMPPEEIDHIDGNPSNNRIGNLRAVDRRTNCLNVAKPIHNTSGICGVYLDKRDNKWNSRIQVDSVTIHLGRFNNIFDAACARKSAEIEHGFHENHGRTP